MGERELGLKGGPTFLLVSVREILNGGAPLHLNKSEGSIMALSFMNQP